MKADKNGIGLKCAKMLLGCNIIPRKGIFDTRKSWKRENCVIDYIDELIFTPFENLYDGDPDILVSDWDDTIQKGYNTSSPLPYFTWQEILWEYPAKFFGGQHVVFNSISKEYENHENFQTNITTKKYREEKLAKSDKKIAYKVIPQQILEELQQEHYNQAEQIFINNCILIKREKT